jgi:hypothetical protein
MNLHGSKVREEEKYQDCAVKIMIRLLWYSGTLPQGEDRWKSAERCSGSKIQGHRCSGSTDLGHSLDSRHPWSQENLPTGSDEELVYKLLTRREYDIRVWVSGDFRGVWT